MKTPFKTLVKTPFKTPLKTPARAAFWLALSVSALSLGGCSEGVQDWAEDRALDREIEAEIQEERRRMNTGPGAAARRDCYGDPTLSCIVQSMEALAGLGGSDIFQAENFAETAIAHALAGNEAKAFEFLERSKAAGNLPHWPDAADDYAEGVPGTALAFARNGNAAAARKALTLAAGAVPGIETDWQRLDAQLEIAATYFALGERRTGNKLVNEVEAYVIGGTMAGEYRVSTVADIVELYAEWGDEAAAWQAYAWLRAAVEKDSEVSLLQSDYRLGMAYDDLAAAQIALGETREAARTVAKLSRTASAQSDSDWRRIFNDYVLIMNREILLAEGGSVAEAGLPSPRSLSGSGTGIMHGSCSPRPTSPRAMRPPRGKPSSMA